jgi:hypothetical protein
MTWTRRLGTTGLATLLGTTLGLVVTASPAQAAPPVVVDDATSMYAGNGREVDVLANDTDADSPDDLTVCRLGKESYKRVFAETLGDGVVFVFALPGARPGTYTFTYYACDFETLVPGTLTVTIDPEPEVRAKALPGRPGKIKVKNPADFKIRFLYGSFKEPNPDATVKIPRNSSVILTVRRTQIDWIALTRKGDFIKRGRIKNITLPPGTTPPAAGRAMSPRLAKLWASGV